MKGDGDFWSRECRAFLEEADVVTTNPPFSLFREYVALLVRHGKDFLIVGNQNAVTYKEIFPLIRDGKLWLGYDGIMDMTFDVPDDAPARETRYGSDEDGGKWRSMGNACWFTNLEHSRRHEKLALTAEYDPDLHPKFDGYDAIEVSKVESIPRNYAGVMAVPITFLDKFCPEQFEIVAFRRNTAGDNLMFTREMEEDVMRPRPDLISIEQVFRSSTSIPGMIKNTEGRIQGRITYARILIRRRDFGGRN